MVNPELRHIAQDTAKCLRKNNTIKADELTKQAEEIIKNDHGLKNEYERCLAMYIKLQNEKVRR